MNYRALLCFALCLLSLSTGAFCYTIKLQQGTPNTYYPFGYTGAQDTYIRTYTAWDPDDPSSQVYMYQDLNFGASPNLEMGIYETMEVYDVAWGLIRFNTSCLNSLAVQSARLYVHCSSVWLIAGAIPSSDLGWVAGTANGAVQTGSSCYS